MNNSQLEFVIYEGAEAGDGGRYDPRSKRLVARRELMGWWFARMRQAVEEADEAPKTGVRAWNRFREGSTHKITSA